MTKYIVVVTIAMEVSADSPVQAQSRAHERIDDAFKIEDEEACPIVDMVTVEGKLHVLDR